MTEIPSNHFVGQVTVKAIIERDGKVLIDRGVLLPEYWELPGGRLHKDEHIVDALKREVREELGVDIEVGRFLHNEEYVRIIDNLPTLMMVYAATMTDPSAAFTLDATEIAEIAWVDKTNYKNFKLFDNCVRALETHYRL
jgi:8-oxo-dGTP pyrophosphatase MutT (NUDIX family)